MAQVDHFIRKLHSIGGLSRGDEDRLRALPVRLINISKGHVVAADGERTSHSCLLIEGFMHREKLTQDGGRQILSVHVPGDVPDIQSLHLPKMDHSLVATTACKVGLIEHDDLDALLEAPSGLVTLLWRDSLIDAASFRMWMLMLGQADAVTRLAHLLCEVFVRLRIVGLAEGRSFEFPLTQAEIADALGVSAVHANRTIQELRATKVVSIDRARVAVLNWNGLRSIATFDPAYLHYLDKADGA